jgi:hypothetical protein
VPAGGTAPSLQSRQVQISSKLRREKVFGPTYRFTASPEVGPGATVGTLQTGYLRAQDLSPAPRRQTPHPTGEGSGATACPCGSRPAPDTGELWHRHVPRGTGHATRYGRASVSSRVPRLQTRLPVRRALASPRIPWHRAHHPAGKGSGVATCLTAPDPSPAREGSGVATCPRHQDHCLAGLWYRHVSCGSRPASLCGRALEPPRACSPQPPRRACVFSRRLTSGSSWPHQARGAGGALNAYKTSHTQRMASIKYVQDIDTTRRRQYDADLLGTHNGQATMWGDLTPRCISIIIGYP